MDDPRCFVIVGGGQAGRWIALTLRADGFTGRICWFGDEVHAPYERPPLSKAALKGEVQLAQLALLPGEKLSSLNVQWRPGERVTEIDRGARCVRTEQGEHVAYDALFLATGGRARTLPGLLPHPRAMTLRTWDDALAMRTQLAQAQHVLVLGGGWIGLEVAASARQLGKDVTVLEAAPRLCARTVPAIVSQHLLALHEGRGVHLRIGQAVQTVLATDDGVEVSLANGERLHGDMLVAGLGMVANDELAAACALAVGNGVLTDAHGRSSDPDIYAVGDVANSLRNDGQRLRLESWENAQRQAVAAAKSALGISHDPQAEGPPWFWSDQYDENLQILGFPSEAQTLIERLVPAKRQRVLFFTEGERVCAIAAMNAGREIKIARRWLAQNRFPGLDALSDASIDLNKLALRAADEQPAAPASSNP